MSFVVAYFINNLTCNLGRLIKSNDLGVILDQKSTFNLHIDNAIGRAFGMLGFFIRCSKEFRDPYTQLYSTSVRPILEYTLN